MNVTINLSRLNIPLVQLVSVGGKLQRLLADPTVTTVLEFSLGERKGMEVVNLCKELKVPYTVHHEGFSEDRIDSMIGR